MENTEETSVERALRKFNEERPRGAVVGDKLTCNVFSDVAHAFHVIASQVWQTTDGPFETALVWYGTCVVCDDPFCQTSPIRPHKLSVCCSGCEPSTNIARIEQTVVAETMRVAGRALICSNKTVSDRAAPGQAFRGVRRRGRMENHILETMTMFDASDTVTLPELVEQSVARLPEPEPGQRDARRQRVIRAIQTLSREKDGPFQLKGNIVVFFE